MKTILSIISLSLAFLCAWSFDEADYWRNYATRQEVWTKCSPPLAHQRLVIEPEWPADPAAKEYTYRCTYMGRRKIDRMEFVSPPKSYARKM